MNLNLHTRKYVKLATLQTQEGLALVAFLIEEEGGEIISISEPRIVKILRKNIALPGQIASPFLLSGKVLRLVFEKAVLSPYADYLDFDTQKFSVYSPRPPTGVDYGIYPPERNVSVRAGIVDYRIN